MSYKHTLRSNNRPDKYRYETHNEPILETNQIRGKPTNHTLEKKQEVTNIPLYI